MISEASKAGSVVTAGKALLDGSVTWSGWAATGDLDAQGERVVGQAWRPISLPLPVCFDTGASNAHDGPPRIGTLTKAIPEGPNLWVEFVLDPTATYYGAATNMLATDDPPAAMSIYASILDSGTRVECDDGMCWRVKELLGLDLLHVLLTTRPANTAALIVKPLPELAGKCDCGPCASTEKAKDDLRLSVNMQVEQLMRNLTAARVLNASLDSAAITRGTSSGSTGQPVHDERQSA